MLHRDSLFEMVQEYHADTALKQILTEFERLLNQKVDRVEFAQIVQTKANAEDLLRL